MSPGMRLRNPVHKSAVLVGLGLFLLGAHGFQSALTKTLKNSRLQRFARLTSQNGTTGSVTLSSSGYRVVTLLLYSAGSIGMTFFLMLIMRLWNSTVRHAVKSRNRSRTLHREPMSENGTGESSSTPQRESRHSYR